MAVSDNAATFLGISNENEFYSAHYLAEVFKGDISDTLKSWKEKEDTLDHFQAPYNGLRAIAREYFVMRERSQRERGHQKAVAMQRDFQQRLCQALEIPWNPQNRRVSTDKIKEDDRAPGTGRRPKYRCPGALGLGRGGHREGGHRSSPT